MDIKVAPLGNIGANFYMIKNDECNEAFVVDPGACPKTIIDLINDSKSTVKYIILTHAHADHIGALDELKKAIDAPVVIHRDESARLNSDEYTLCPMFGIPTPSTCADILVDDGVSLPFGNDKIEFIHTPGHTPGSMCIKYKDILLSGDTLFRLSIGRTDFPGGSFDDIVASIQSGIYSLDPDTVIYPGHGDATTVRFETQNNPYVRGRQNENYTY